MELTVEQELVLTLWHQARENARQASAAIAEYAKQFATTFDEVKVLNEKVSKAFFPEAKEGTSTFALPQGWALKQTIKYDRKVDKTALPTVRERLEKRGVSLDLLICNKPELELRAYRQLTAEDRAIMDEVLTTKPGAPTLELVEPKEKAK